MSKPSLCAAVLGALTLCPLFAKNEHLRFYPGEPAGVARIRLADSLAVIENEALNVTCDLSKGLVFKSIANRYTGSVDTLDIPLFKLNYTVAGVGKSIRSDEFTVESVKKTQKAGNPKASVLAQRFDRQSVEIKLVAEDFQVLVRLVSTTGGNYIRPVLYFEVNRPLKVDSLDFLPGLPGEWKPAGQVNGVPLVNEFTFVSSEHPAAKFDARQRSQHLACGFDLKRNSRWSESMVLGVSPQGQLRRGFLHYIERERANPYHVFPHYNNWTVTTYVERPYDEETVRKTIVNWGEKFIKPYGVRIDSFALDDGWDDYNNSLWEFNKERFPNGFLPLQPLLEKYHSSIGIWLSPFGGYASARAAREKYARKIGLLKPGAHLSLADKAYYDLFWDRISKIQREQNVNYLKIDRLGGVKELNAAKEIFEKLRKIRPDVFINLTRDSWPSPFWLRIADSLWRGGEDSPLYPKAPGSNVRKWIAYRDGTVHQRVVEKSPLYPITSLMTDGLIYSKLGPPHAFVDQDMDDWYDQAQSFVASGVNCQELYLDYTLMTDERWAFLAKLLKWSRANQDILVDTHWTGGDPFKLEPYGFASWTPDKAILTLRNPSDKEASFTIDPMAIFELPESVKGVYQFEKLWDRDGKLTSFECETGFAMEISLPPLTTITWEARLKRRVPEGAAPDVCLLPE